MKPIYWLLTLLAGLTVWPGRGAEWTWQWTPAPEGAKPAAVVEPFKYGKRWAYAVEIDDGPMWVRSFAVPFLAGYHFTDAPPGVAGGKAMPLVGSVAVIAGVTGYNRANLDWDDLRAVMAAGWGVMNHSFDHRGRDWDGPAGQLSDEAVRQDAFWSQALFAAHLPDGRTPTAAAYANGYVDYDRGGALAAVGVGVATRVGGRSTPQVYHSEVKWMDFPRSYLDEGVWSKTENGAPMAGFPGAAQGGPPAGSLVIGESTLAAQWHVGSHLCPVLPTMPAILGTGIVVQPVPELKQMTVWAAAEP
jgi:hypothetical protein